MLELERRRLKEAGRAKLAARVKHTAQTDDSAGFDILSFELDGRERPIEVKATSAARMDHGFFISTNELAQADS